MRIEVKVERNDHAQTAPFSPSRAALVYLALADASANRAGRCLLRFHPLIRRPGRSFSFVMTIAALFTSANVSPGEREDRSNRWVLFARVRSARAALPPGCSRLHRSPGILDHRRRHRALDRRFALRGGRHGAPLAGLRARPPLPAALVAIQPGHTLVTTGIYRTIRHQPAISA